jgi:hypothetical protein
VIIDAHSFPIAPLPTQVDFGDPPEIGIGTDAMHTSAALAEVVHACPHRLSCAARGVVTGARIRRVGLSFSRDYATVRSTAICGARSSSRSETAAAPPRLCRFLSGVRQED